MDVQQLLDSARDSLTVKRVFGDPYEHEGNMIIPVARVRGAGGGGQGDAPEQGTGSGGGFGLSARPVGVYIVAGGEACWQPALDVNRIVLGAQVIAVCALLVTRSIVRARARVSADA